MGWKKGGGEEITVALGQFNAFLPSTSIYSCMADIDAEFYAVLYPKVFGAEFGVGAGTALMARIPMQRALFCR